MWIPVLIIFLIPQVAVRMTSSQVTDVQQESCYNDDSTLRQMQLLLSQLLTEVKEVKTALQALNTTPTIKTIKECPTNFVFNATANVCYKLQLNNVDWTAGATGCKLYHKDAHMVIIDSAAEQNAFVNFIKSYSESTFREAGCFYDTASSGGFGFFTAGQRIDPENDTQFLWRILNANGTATECLRPMTYSNFHPGEPNNGLGGPKESCMNIYINWNYLWNDIPCYLPICSVCEIDM